jgi:hypothetical protein
VISRANINILNPLTNNLLPLCTLNNDHAGRWSTSLKQFLFMPKSYIKLWNEKQWENSNLYFWNYSLPLQPHCYKSCRVDPQLLITASHNHSNVVHYICFSNTLQHLAAHLFLLRLFFIILMLLAMAFIKQGLLSSVK